ncbi:MAG: TlyA family RNA methyltransferase [Deltaproteobacteria bacterium]
MPQTKTRLDALLVDRGLSSSLHEAQAMIMSGKVFVNEEKITKSGTQIKDDAVLSLHEPEHSFVSRGGVKLKGALEKFNITVVGMTALDIGASTGGFTDCLLQAGAKKIYALDVGYGQIAWKLRTSAMVVVMDKTNIRHLDAKTIPDEIDIVVIDVSFISLKMVLPKAVEIIKTNGEIVALIKPQFEANKGDVGRGGIVANDIVCETTIANISEFAKQKLALLVVGVCKSPIKGHDGNQEFFIHLRKVAV